MKGIKTPKIETPHQLLVHLVCIDDKHWPRCKKNGDYSEKDAEKEALLAARDALIRIDERQRAAGWEMARYCTTDCGKDEKNNSICRAAGGCFEIRKLKAAIMAEPEEAHS